jgi:AcrR family transcriptional regulator
MLRKLKKAIKKESILQTALTLFSVKGFHKTTIPDIAKRLGMSSGNLYSKKTQVATPN